MSLEEVYCVFASLGLETQDNREKVLYQGHVYNQNKSEKCDIKVWFSENVGPNKEEKDAKLEGYA